MSIPTSVWHRVFAGVGTTYPEVLRSRDFRSLVRRTESLNTAYPLSTAEGLALRLGHMEYGALVNPFQERLPTLDELRSARHAPPKFCIDATDRVLLHYLAKHIIRSAKATLPKEFISLARHFRRTPSAKTQIEIVTQLCETLRLRTSASFMEDMCNQPAERVLPVCYRAWQESDKNRPNCLGKSQLLAAFFDEAQARAFIAIPFDSPHQESRILLREIYRLASEVVRSSGDKRLLPYLEWSIKVCDKVDKTPSYMHACVIVQLRDSRWLICDPNYELIVELPAPFQMPVIAERLEALSGFLPGISFTMKSTHFDEYFNKADCLKKLRTARQFFETISRHSFRPSQGLRLLQRSNLLREIRDFASQAYQKLSPEAKAERKAKSLLKRPFTDWECSKAILIRHLCGVDATAKDLDSKILEGHSWEALSNQSVESSLNDQTVSFLFDVLFDIQLRADTELENLAPSVYEFGNLQYQVALATLRHVALDMGLGAETSLALLDHSFGQFYLQDAYLWGAGDSQYSSPLTRRAGEILAAQPQRLRSADFVLKEERCVQHVA